MPLNEQKRQLELLHQINADQLARRAHDDELSAVVNSYEMAFRMQMNAPGVTDLSQETAATQKLYGIGEEGTDEFGKQCLIARRMAEAGVRYIQVSYATTPRIRCGTSTARSSCMPSTRRPRTARSPGCWPT